MQVRDERCKAIVDVEWAVIDGHGVLVCRAVDDRLPWSYQNPGSIPCEYLDLDPDVVGSLVDRALPLGWALCRGTAVVEVEYGFYFVRVVYLEGETDE